jgi:hypothetical protein
MCFFLKEMFLIGYSSIFENMRMWCGLSQKRVVRSKCDIYVLVNCLWYLKRFGIFKCNIFGYFHGWYLKRFGIFKCNIFGHFHGWYLKRFGIFKCNIFEYFHGWYLKRFGIFKCNIFGYFHGKSENGRNCIQNTMQDEYINCSLLHENGNWDLIVPL